jgi:HJR/Mrr/RecB family endonuclease
MMIHGGGVLLFLGGLTAPLLSVFVGFRIVDAILSQGVYNTDNAEELLKSGRPEEWNALRLLNPNWQPILTSRKLTNLNLPGVDFRRAKLDESDLSMSVLDDADFSMASLKSVNFSGTSLQGANLDHADLTQGNLDGAVMDGASLKGTILHETKVPHMRQAPKEIQIPRDQLPSFIKHNPDRLSEISPRQFEELVAEVLERSGHKTALTAGSRDKGVDIIASRSDPFGDVSSVIECKHYSAERPVGVSSVRALYAAKEIEDTDRAILITSSRFSNEAREFASRLPDVELIDREGLLKLITELPL